jgi:hypothetical protein
MAWEVEDYYYDIREGEEVLAFLSTLKKLRGGLYFDPDLLRPWSCDPDRCRPLLGRNLCCKVEMRCHAFNFGVCGIHENKPFSCALFPMEIIRVGSLRAVVSAENPLLYEKAWTRYDRDMLKCFVGDMKSRTTLFEVQDFIIEKVFTKAEAELLRAAHEALKNEKSPL